MPALHTPTQAVQWLQQRGCKQLWTDSRKAMPGSAYLAWPGGRVDARQYLPGALQSGASACLVEQEGAAAWAGFDEDAVGTYPGLKADTGPIASEFFGQPSQQLAVIAVTGTNGKTSTAWWLAQALSALPAGQALACGVIGTLGVGRPPAVADIANTAHTAATLAMQGRVGVGGVPGLMTTGFTTPDPVVLQQTLRQMVDEGLQACAIEASSIGIEEHRLSGTHIRVAVFTNFTQDHLDYHGNMEAYWQSKSKLFAWPGLASVVLNVDDAKGAALAQQLASGHMDVWTVACASPARLQAKNIRYAPTGLQFDVVETEPATAETAALPMHTGVIGHYNVLNLLGVLGAMRSLGVPLALAVQACSNLRPVPGRMECWGGEGEPLVAVDYAHTPDALAHALAALRPLALQRGGKLWCVFGCGGDRDSSKRPLMGAVATQNADHVVLTSDNPRSERPEAIIAQVLLGVTHSKAVEVQADRALAIADVVARVQAQDVVLLAGKGHETTQDIAGVKQHFSDTEHALVALTQRRSATREVTP